MIFKFIQTIITNGGAISLREKFYFILLQPSTTWFNFKWTCSTINIHRPEIFCFQHCERRVQLLKNPSTIAGVVSDNVCGFVSAGSTHVHSVRTICVCSVGHLLCGASTTVHRLDLCGTSATFHRFDLCGASTTFHRLDLCCTFGTFHMLVVRL